MGYILNSNIMCKYPSCYDLEHCTDNPILVPPVKKVSLPKLHRRRCMASQPEFAASSERAPLLPLITIGAPHARNFLPLFLSRAASDAGFFAAAIAPQGLRPSPRRVLSQSSPSSKNSRISSLLSTLVPWKRDVVLTRV